MTQHSLFLEIGFQLWFSTHQPSYDRFVAEGLRRVEDPRWVGTKVWWKFVEPWGDYWPWARQIWVGTKIDWGMFPGIESCWLLWRNDGWFFKDVYKTDSGWSMLNWHLLIVIVEFLLKHLKFDVGWHLMLLDCPRGSFMSCWGFRCQAIPCMVRLRPWLSLGGNWKVGLDWGRRLWA